MVKKSIFMVFFFFILIGQVESMDEEERKKGIQSELNYYFEKIGNGLYDIYEPFHYGQQNDKQRERAKKYQTWYNKDGHRWLIFINILDTLVSRNGLGSLFDPFYYDTKTLPKEFFSKILKRRIIIINSFETDMCDPATFAYFSSQWGYLGFVWDRLVLLMTYCEDYRFEEDVLDLLEYIKKPLTDMTKKGYFDAKDLQEPRLRLGGATRHKLPLTLLKYIKLCREKNSVSPGKGKPLKWKIGPWEEVIKVAPNGEDIPK